MVSGDFRAAQPVAVCCQTDGMRNEQIFSVHGDAELLARAGHFFESARTDFLCVARDLSTWAQPEARAAIQGRMRPAASPGFTTRKLLSPVALTEEESRAHLRQVRSNGAQVRITDSAVPHETIIIDRRVMILAGRDSTAGREYSVTTSKNMIDGVHSLFSAMWDQSTDLDAYLREDTPHLDPDARTILEALGSGLTDASAAGRLGLSLRTYRRRVADLMVTLEAGSRFQAGLRAGELGLPGRAGR